MVENNVSKDIFKWWHVEGITNYASLLEEKAVSLVAITRDNRVIRKTAPLAIVDQTAVADCGTEGRFYLMPDGQVTRHAERINSYWLLEKGSRDPKTPTILGIYSTIDDGMAVLLPKGGISLFGRGTQVDREFVYRDIDIIVPIGNGKCIACGDNVCAILGDRETEERTIEINLKRINY